jgi:cob(I)alamin adenosyltransferase
MTERIYTRTGDAGDTGLFGGGRIPKSHPRVEAYGAVDELNANLGMALTAIRDATLRDRLRTLQADLFTVGAHLATTAPDGARPRAHLPDLPAFRAEDIENWIDEIEAGLEALSSFILPGGSAAAASLHVCRTVCRRAERRVVALAAAEPVDPDIIVILNRISDFLFVAARAENAAAGEEDLRWDPGGRSQG